jgi:EAL domain-containing protein (putative c-di-GMP-specific phosphodiesterase class I)
MAGNSIFSNLLQQEDGSWTAAYGPFVLHSALQPIFSQDANGNLDIQAFEGLIRPMRGEDTVRPADFFSQVPRNELVSVDSLCRTLHIFNTGALHRRNAKLFLSFQPGLFVNSADIRREAELMKLSSTEAGMSPDRIACKISRRGTETAEMPMDLVEELRGHGFRIAIDEYGADQRDAERLNVLRPDYVKFEAEWVKDFLENSAGSALLRHIVRTFQEQGILSIFEGLEDMRQVEICGHLEVPLLQGYAMARPQLAPTTFNDEYPETGTSFAATPKPAADLERYNPELHMPKAPTGSYGSPLRKSATFGKRTR